MGWKIIEIENSQKLSLFLDNIVIFNNDNEKITIPLNDIDVILINNFKINISIQLINKISENNIVCIICDNSYIPSSLVIPIIGNFNTIKILDSQINWNHKWKSEVWKQIIQIKIDNQIYFLRNIIKNEQVAIDLDSLKSNIKPYDISNREGHASKIYWHSLFGTSFKRFEDDYINSLLNYGYTILRAYFTRSIIKKGLDPRISIFHRSYHNYFALSSDLMEPFRIIIDFVVYKIYLSNEKNFYNHKQELIEIFNEKVKIDNKLYYINKAIDLFVDAIVNQTKLPVIDFSAIIKL